jgi:hypothetical protein
MIAGMHIGFRGVGHVVKAGSGYAFIPVWWSGTLLGGAFAGERRRGIDVPLPRSATAPRQQGPALNKNALQGGTHATLMARCACRIVDGRGRTRQGAGF